MLFMGLLGKKSRHRRDNGMMLFRELIAGILNMHRGPNLLYITPAWSVCILRLKPIYMKRFLTSTRKD